MEIAALQIASGRDRDANRRDLAALFEEASSSGACVAVAPEASQRAFGSPGEPLAPNPESLDGPFCTFLAAEARRLDLVIAAGMFEVSDEPDRPFNTTVVVGPSGIQGVYRKIHLYDALGFVESDGITEGPTSPENTCVVDVEGISIGVMTCFDLRFPESARALVDAGADVLMLGAAWLPGARKVDQWRTLLAARAIESTAYVVAAAQPGPRYCGNSAIMGPEGEVLAEAPGEWTGVLRTEISSQRVAEVRGSMPVLSQRRLGDRR